MSIGHSISEFVQSLVPGSTVTASNVAPKTPPPAGYNVRGIQLSDRDLQTLRNVLFAEVSNRSADKQALEARTIINTALNRVPQYTQHLGKPVDLHTVLTMPNQYQGYMSPQYMRVVNNATTTTDGQKLKAIDDTIGQLKSGAFPDTTGGRVFYKHTPAGVIELGDGTLYKQPKAPRNFKDLSSNI